MELRKNNRFLTFSFLNSPRYSSCQCTAGSSRGRSTSHSRTSAVDSHNLGHFFVPDGSSPNCSHQNCFTCTSQGYAPSQLSPATSSTSILNCQGASPTNAAKCTTDQASSYFLHNPHHPQSYAKQEQQPASIFQDREFSLDPNSNNLVPSSPIPPPYQPTRHDEELNTVAGSNYSSPDPQRCTICRKGLRRQTNFERHLKTAKLHRQPSGPACPARARVQTSRTFYPAR
ncbi:hypothetical protein HOY80DRAFT_271912 [Tuber brumale]|nr:hypothetical protein HOY80DRAFT_271912 [Tuber brumale]